MADKRTGCSAAPGPSPDPGDAGSCYRQEVAVAIRGEVIMVRRRWILILLAALWCVAMGWQVSLAKGQAAGATGLKWQPTLDDAKREAAQSNRLILVHFWAPSCKECVQLEKDVYSQPRVQEAVNARFVPLKLNSDDFPTTTRQYGVDRLPTDLIITPAGQIVGRMKCPLTADAYLQQLNIAASGAGPSTQLTGAPAASATAANAAPVQSPLAPPVNALPNQPPISSPTTMVNPQAASPNSAVINNPAWAIQPPAHGVAQSAQAAAMASQPAKSPAVAAYSDDRYSDYFRRFSSDTSAAAVPAATAAAGNSPTVNPVGVSLPAAAPQVQSSAAPQSSLASSPYAPSATSVPQYNPPPANPVQYTSPAAATPPQNYSISPTGSFAWPATPAPALNSAAATQPYTGAPTAGIPNGTLTGLSASAPAATPTPTASAAPPPLGLDGYCPVTLADQKRWQVGDRRFGVIHRGRTYLFAGPVEQQKFLSNPDHYSPAISGQDVVMALDQGQTVDGHRQYGVQYQGRTYLFASDSSRRAFSQNPKHYAAEVLQAENPNRPPLR